MPFDNDVSNCHWYKVIAHMLSDPEFVCACTAMDYFKLTVASVAFCAAVKCWLEKMHEAASAYFRTCRVLAPLCLLEEDARFLWTQYRWVVTRAYSMGQMIFHDTLYDAIKDMTDWTLFFEGASTSHGMVFVNTKMSRLRAVEWLAEEELNNNPSIRHHWHRWLVSLLHRLEIGVQFSPFESLVKKPSELILIITCIESCVNKLREHQTPNVMKLVNQVVLMMSGAKFDFESTCERGEKFTSLISYEAKKNVLSKFARFHRKNGGNNLRIAS